MTSTPHTTRPHAGRGLSQGASVALLLLLLPCAAHAPPPRPDTSPQQERPTQPVALHNHAVRALEAGDLREARTSARALLAIGGAYAAPAHELLGHVALAHAEQAHAQATGPEAEPFAWDAAITYGSEARDQWVTAVVVHHREHNGEHGGDRPAVRRNVQRVMARLEEWRRLRDANRPESLKEKDKARMNPKLVANTQDQPQASTPRAEEEPASSQDDPNSLDPQQVQQYFELLDTKRADRDRLRAAARTANSQRLEKDW